MKSFSRRRRASLRILLSIATLALLALFVALAAGATAMAIRTRPVRDAATLKIAPTPPIPPGAPDYTLFTIGHARIVGNCGGPGGTEGWIVKVAVIAVGGDITLNNGAREGEWNNAEVLHPGEEDAVVMEGSGAGPRTGSTTFAVFDNAGPSFSGTAAGWVTSMGCIATAQVAG
jgi:hypothetical protein